MIPGITKSNELVLQVASQTLSTRHIKFAKPEERLFSDERQT